MKKIKQENSSVGCTGFTVNGYVIHKYQGLVGELLTLADTLGLQDKQSEAYKSLVKQAMWDFWDRPQYSYSYEDDKLITGNEAVKM